MTDDKSIFPQKSYSRVALCVVIFFCLLLCYNGLWNIALYPTEGLTTETLQSFMDACLMFTSATLIAASFGVLSIWEFVCTVPDNEWKTAMEMFLWALLIILVSSYLAYLISTGNNSGVGIWMILVITSVVNIIWSISMIILLQSSKRMREFTKKLEYEDDNNQNGNKESEVNVEKTISRRELVLNTIRQIGSEPDVINGGLTRFEYQGAHFFVEADDECEFINMILPWCHIFSKFDIDEFAGVQKIMNKINAKGSVSAFYSFDDSDDVSVNIKKHFLFIEKIPNIDDYMKCMLNLFFETARTMWIEIDKSRLQEWSDNC